MSLWVAGAALALTGSVFSNLGVNIQKWSFMKQELLPECDRKSHWVNPSYLLGLSLVIFGALFDFAALALASLSIVAPIGSVTLVANIFFAKFWLKEVLSKRDVVGTALIVFGSTLSVSFGNHDDNTYTIDELLGLYGGPLFLVYAGLITLVSCVLYYLIRKILPIKTQLIAASRLYEEAIKNNQTAEAIEFDLQIAALEEQYAPYEKIHPFSYCSLSGILGAQSILFGKMVSSLISTTIKGDIQLVNPLFYVFIVAMGFFIASQLHFLALGLSYFDALYCVPIFQCFFITISTLGGAAYFLEFSSFTPLQAAFFPLGMCFTILGVYFLSTRKMSKPKYSASGGLQEGLVSGQGQELTTTAAGEPLSPVSSNGSSGSDEVRSSSWFESAKTRVRGLSRGLSNDKPRQSIIDYNPAFQMGSMRASVFLGSLSAGSQSPLLTYSTSADSSSVPLTTASLSVNAAASAASENIHKESIVNPELVHCIIAGSLMDESGQPIGLAVEESLYAQRQPAALTDINVHSGTVASSLTNEPHKGNLHQLALSRQAPHSLPDHKSAAPRPSDATSFTAASSPTGESFGPLSMQSKRIIPLTPHIPNYHLTGQPPAVGSGAPGPLPAKQAAGQFRRFSSKFAQKNFASILVSKDNIIRSNRNSLVGAAAASPVAHFTPATPSKPIKTPRSSMKMRNSFIATGAHDLTLLLPTADDSAPLTLPAMEIPEECDFPVGSLQAALFGGV